MKKQSAKAKLKARMHTEYMKGYRLGFDRGYADGSEHGRNRIQEQFRELLVVDKSPTISDKPFYLMGSATK